MLNQWKYKLIEIIIQQISWMNIYQNVYKYEIGKKWDVQ